MSNENEETGSIMVPRLNLTQKIAKITRSIPKVVLEGHYRSDHGGNYDFLTEAQAIALTKNKMADLNIMLTTSIISVQTEHLVNNKGNKYDLVTIATEHEFCDGDSGECKIIKGAGQAADYGDKALYKAHTGSHKYAIAKTFKITTADDPETGQPLNDPEDKKNKHRSTRPYEDEPPRRTDAAKADLEMLRKWGVDNGVTEEFIIKCARTGKMATEETKSIDELKPGSVTRMLGLRAGILKRWREAQEKAGTTSVDSNKSESGKTPRAKPKRTTPEGEMRRVTTTDEDPAEVVKNAGYNSALDVPVGFGAKAKLTLRDLLNEDDLRWWMTEWQPKKYKGGYSDVTVLLDCALTVAQQELAKKAENPPQGDSDRLPFD